MQLARGWRAFRTGVAFSVFGVGAVTLAALVFPVVRLLPGTPEGGQLRAQWLIHQTFRVFTWFMEVLGLIRVSRVRTERLRSSAPCVVVANHPTLIDVVLLIAQMPQADCVVKKASWRNRFLRGVVLGAGYIPNDNGAALVEAGATRLRAGRRVLLFPEGTRSPRGDLGDFRRGAARIALESGCDLLPVVITCEPPTLRKGEKWYHVPDRGAHLTLEVQPPIAARDYLEHGTNRALAARRLTDDLRTVFERRLRYDPGQGVVSPDDRGVELAAGTP